MLDNIVKILNKYNISKTEVLLIANKILNNDLILKYGYIPEDLSSSNQLLKYDKSFSWQIDIGDKTNMAMLHLHSWEPVNYLLLAFHDTNNYKYLIKCNELIESWFAHSKCANHKYLYYTHCVADRSLILGYLKLINSEFISNDILNNLITKHIEFLTNEKNYVMYNHGSMLDRSLLLLTLTLRNKPLFDFSLNRFRKNIKNTFTKNMICKENSFTYSIFNLELIVTTQKLLLDDHDIYLIDNFEEHINSALDFLDIVRKPNGILPLYGDGELIDEDKLKNSVLNTYYPNHNLFKPVLIGNKIESYYYRYESYIIIKSADFYLFIRPGDIIKNHKHADDLSFNLYIGEDIIIDTGTYNYDKGTYRSYLKSTSAHNGVELNNENYNYLTSKKDELFIHSFSENDDYIHIALVNKSYSYANITRNLYVLKNSNSLLISDYILSPIKVFSSQIFNLSKQFKNDLEINIENNIIEINNKFQFKSLNESTRKYTFTKSNLYSELFQKSEIIPKIEFTNFKNYTNQVTFIGNINNSISLIENERNLIKVMINEKEITLPVEIYDETIEIHRYVNIYRDSHLHNIEIYCKPYEHCEYAIYIYNEENVRLDILWYQSSPNFTYKFPSDGLFRIRCFIRDSSTGDKFEFSNLKNIKTYSY